ncbi:sensor of ECF-type sigma factor [uncultured Polaribacter sp.]|uniref:sensor of ECF-type sigma factor n=1 Tax=uncultured Polaribacter sp. TaxID=174711 RepID=UPI002611C8E0|nr:sensor of ECF-type sigma factor [uncultured Polaribacter sp.]
MKKYLFILTLFLTAFYSLGQTHQESRKKIKALKIAYLTEQLNLTSSEAEKFWPIYNLHEEKLNLLRNKDRLEIRKKIKEAGSLDNLKEAEAKKFVLLKISLDKKMLLEKEDFFSKISKFLPYNKILKLHISERDFARKLMKKYGKGRKNEE